MNLTTAARADLKSTPLDTSGTRAQIAAQATDLGVKAATVKANTSRLAALSDARSRPPSVSCALCPAG